MEEWRSWTGLAFGIGVRRLVYCAIPLKIANKCVIPSKYLAYHLKMVLVINSTTLAPT